MAGPWCTTCSRRKRFLASVSDTATPCAIILCITFNSLLVQILCILLAKLHLSLDSNVFTNSHTESEYIDQCGRTLTLKGAVGHPGGGNVVSISLSFILLFYWHLKFPDLPPHTQEYAETDQKPIAQNRVSKHSTCQYLLNIWFKFSSGWTSLCFTVNGFLEQGGGRICFIHLHASTMYCSSPAGGTLPAAHLSFRLKTCKLATSLWRPCLSWTELSPTQISMGLYQWFSTP